MWIFQSLHFFTKCPALDVWQGSEYRSESCSLLQGLKIGGHYLKKPSLPLILLKKDSTAVALSGLFWFYKSSLFVEYLWLVTTSAKPIMAESQTKFDIVTLQTTFFRITSKSSFFSNSADFWPVLIKEIQSKQIKKIRKLRSWQTFAFQRWLD